MQGEPDFRPWITGIASVQRTCGIDPKVLGSVALSGVAGASEKPACWVSMRRRQGQGSTKKRTCSTHRLQLSGWNGLFMRDSSLCWVGWVTCDLMTCADGRVTLGQFDPIQAPGSRRPWLSCVGESGSQCEDDFGLDRRGWEASQAPWKFPLCEK